MIVLDTPEEMMQEIWSKCKLKPIDVTYNTWDTLNNYLGSDYGKYELYYGSTAWYTIP